PRGMSNILFIRNLFLPSDLGGNRYPYETMRRLGGRGHQVTVVTPRLHDHFPGLQNVQYHWYSVRRPHPAVTHLTNLLGATLALRRLQGRFDVAIAGSYDAALAAIWAGLAERVPLVFLFHSEFYSEWVQALGAASKLIRRYMAAVERRVFALSARIVAVSQFSARQVEQRLAQAAAMVRVVPTGVETDYFCPAGRKAEAKRALGLPPDLPLVLGVGRLAGVKQFDRLITAFAVAGAAGLRARLVIAGAGPEHARLEHLIGTYGVADSVHLAGYCDPPQLRRYMQAADLQVCCSAFENLSLAILEGMACGTPVLGTPGGGTPELVGAIDPALVLADDRSATIADALPVWLGQPERLGQLGARARALAVERYDWERVVDGLEAVCAEVVPGWR
ncbi:MAG: glycosyltransferase family 4 protein, partial [Chloroflexota bacterium]|nr:glycosyltransferase family 4 protein [Chloroflexota bacterium]